jgi:hypothetical protein
LQAEAALAPEMWVIESNLPRLPNRYVSRDNQLFEMEHLERSKGWDLRFHYGHG